MDLVFDETTGTWTVKKEPYTVIEVQTEQDFHRLENSLKMRDELSEVGLYPGGDVWIWVQKVEDIIKKYADIKESSDEDK